MEDWDLICIFDLQLFVDPVRAEDGKTYSRANIEKYFESREAQSQPIISPLTRAQMGKKLRPDTKAAAAVAKRHKGVVIDFKALIPGARSIHDLGEVFSTLDSVREVLSSFLDGWQPPQLVMVGKESSGKSSVLERLCMMPIFPRADNVCTRTPIHVRLRNSKSCQAATLEVYNTQTKQTEDGPHVIPTETGAIDVKAKMDEVLQKEPGNHRLSMDRIIIIRITSPYVPSIDLIDMPGLVTSPPEDRDRTRQLVTNHISQHGKYSLYLATVTADDAPNTSAAMEIVQAHSLQSRTIGVFTMVDEVVPRKWDNFMQRLQNPSEVENGGVPIQPHGWVPVVNAEVKNGCSNNIGKLAMQARDEEECLQKLMPGPAAKGQAGCRALVGKLHTLFFDFLKEEWGPKTVRMLQSACEAADLESAVLGMPAFYGRKTEAQAREGAVEEARKRLTAKASGLTDECCKGVLNSLKSEVEAVFASKPAVNLPAGTLPGFLREHREKVGEKCEEFVDKWAEYWVGAVRGVLESRTAAPPENADQDVKNKRVESPEFELGRFPAFIEAVLEELEALLRIARATLRTTLRRCLATYYGEMSPWLRYASNLGSSPPLITVTFDTAMLIESVVVAFVREGDDVVAEHLCGSLGKVADSLQEKPPLKLLQSLPTLGPLSMQGRQVAWVESCAAERVALLAKVRELKRAQGEILRSVFGVGSVAEMEEKLKKP